MKVIRNFRCYLSFILFAFVFISCTPKRVSLEDLRASKIAAILYEKNGISYVLKDTEKILQLKELVKNQSSKNQEKNAISLTIVLTPNKEKHEIYHSFMEYELKMVQAHNWLPLFTACDVVTSSQGKEAFFTYGVEETSVYFYSKK